MVMMMMASKRMMKIIMMIFWRMKKEMVGKSKKLKDKVAQNIISSNLYLMENHKDLQISKHKLMKRKLNFRKMFRY